MELREPWDCTASLPLAAQLQVLVGCIFYASGFSEQNIFLMNFFEFYIFQSKLNFMWWSTEAPDQVVLRQGLV